ncbi:hypothetical protein ScPMuIL_005825 [Solemya velum]
MADKAMEPAVEKRWQLERRMQKHDQYRGSKYPPFSIEPQPYERERLSGKGMSAEDRVLRGQWVKDQVLSHNEPRFVEAVQPKNAFRRFYGKPMDIMFEALQPVIGKIAAGYGRLLVPRGCS